MSELHFIVLLCRKPTIITKDLRALKIIQIFAYTTSTILLKIACDCIGRNDSTKMLFTKHLLEALNGKADSEDYGNQDGKVTLAELRTYLDEEMTYQARRRYNRDQKASVQGKLNSVLAIPPLKDP